MQNKCARCGNYLRVSKEQVGVDAYNNPIYKNFAICDTCQTKVELYSSDKRKQSSLSAASCVLSLFGCTLLIGFILAIIDLSKKDKTEKHTGSIFSIVIFCIASLIITIGFLFPHEPASVQTPNESLSNNEVEIEESEVSENEVIEQDPVSDDVATQEETAEEDQPEEVEENIYCQEILFMDFPWGTSFAEIDSAHPEYNMWNFSGDCYQTYSIDDIVLGSYQGIDFEYDDINIIGDCYYETEVAGYTPAEITLYFSYSIVDGVLMQTEEDSQLYGGQYVFETQNLEAMTADLIQKLSSVYGESDNYIEDDDLWGNYYTYTYWYGENDTMVVLKTLDAEEDDELYYDEITISYVWMHGDTLLQDASDYLQRIAEQEEEETYNNGNTTGL